jgi:predicted exporter
MYTWFKKHRIVINLLIIALGIILVILKLNGFINSYALIGIVLVLGVIFNNILVYISSKRKKSQIE